MFLLVKEGEVEDGWTRYSLSNLLRMMWFTFFFLGVMAFLSVATLNVNGLRNGVKRNVIFENLQRKKFSLIFLQETHSEVGDEQLWENEWKGVIHFNHGSRKSRGVAILISDKSGLVVTNIHKDDDGRWLSGEIMWNNSIIYVASVYAPNDIHNRVVFFDNLVDKIDDKNDWIVGGDFNCDLDRVQIKDVSKTILQNVMNEKDLLDVWLTINSNIPGFTHYHKGTRQQSRIDYLMVSSNVIASISNVQVHSFGLSDHHILGMKLEVPLPNGYGKGRWICNNSLLKEEEASFRIKHFWSFWQAEKHKYNHITDWWELGKSRVKEILQELGKEKAQKDKRVRSELQRQYNLLIQNPECANPEDIKSLEIKMNNYDIQEWRRAQVRVRNVMKDEGEKPSKFFLQLEKQNCKSSRLDKLLNHDGTYTDTLDGMLNIANTFYSNLYKCESVSKDHLQNIISNIQEKEISDDVSNDLEKDISNDEVKVALYQMNKNKSPGIDGLTVEFYQYFWDIIGTDLVEVYNDCFESGSLSLSMNSALIRLIYKNSGSRHELKNWRPISLLTVDYKILSKVITNRLKVIMPSLVGEEQSCGVVGRKIHHNLMLLRDVVDYANWANLESAIVSIDQEKAFDRINWNYLFAVMEKMKVPAVLIKWIKLLYSNPNCRIIINNCIGSPVMVKRGIRQGCPLSPLLFSICAEGLAALVRNNSALKGIVLPDGQSCVKIIQHADDTSLFVGNDNDFRVIDGIFSVYSKGSGSKINVEKSKGLWLGSWKMRVDKPCGFQWGNKLKILGIYFGSDVTPVDSWEPRISKMQGTLNKWSRRSLTYNGKAVIVNSFVGASLNYVGSVVPCPDHLIKKMSTMIWHFFWDGKIDRIKRSTIVGPKSMGGIGLIDIACKLLSVKLQWLKCYCNEQGAWKIMFDYWIRKASGSDNLGWYIFANVKRPLLTTAFYADLITAFQKTGGQVSKDFSSLLECGEIPLWNNVVVTRDSSVLKSKILQDKGYNYLKDITRDNELITFQEVGQKCNVKNIISGRLMGRVRKHVDKSLIQEKRLGPPNHPCMRLTLFNFGADSSLYVSEINTKTVYKSLILQTFATPKIQNVWQNVLHLGKSPEWPRVWSSIWGNKLLDPEDKQFWYKLKFRILPTKDLLFKIGKVGDVLCPLCKTEVETHEHLFIYCTYTQDAWIFVEQVLRKLSGNRHFFLNDSNRILGYNLEPVYSVIVCKMLRQIWKIRCDVVFDSVLNDVNITVLFQRSLKWFLSMEKSRLGKESFNAIYGKKRALCTCQDNEIQYFF